MRAIAPLVRLRPESTETTAGVWCMRDVDLEPVLAWLGPKLRQKWPRAMDPAMRFWMKAAMSDRHTHFVRSQNVVAMVHVLADVIEPEPRVVEKFMRGNDQATHAERQMVYEHLTAWAQSIGAREFVFNIDSDARMSQDTRGIGVTRALQDDRKNRNVKSRPTFAVVFKEDE